MISARLVQGYVLPSLVTILLHAAMLWMIGDNWNLEKPERYVKPRVINARLVSIEQPKAAPKPVKQATRAKPKPAPPKQVPPKPQPKPKPKPKPKPEPDLAKQKAEQERRERERRQREQQAAEQQLAVLMAEEEAFLEAQSQQELAMSHIGAIQQAIADSWSRPASARRSMEVSLLISLIPTGEVVTVRVLQGSGNTAFDRSAINAVNKAARFSDLAELPPAVFEKYFRALRLVFRPEDLRL